MMIESDALKMLKRSLADYAQTSVRFGNQAEDCLLWGFVTVLSIQAKGGLDGSWHDYQPEAVIKLTLSFLDDLEQQSFNSKGLKQLQPPNLTSRNLFHVVSVAIGRQFTKEELNLTLDWIVEQFRFDMQGCITPKEVASVMISLLELKEGSKVLDPAMGSGAFLQIVKSELGFPIDFIGIEKNEMVASISFLYSYLNDYGSTEIKVGGAFYHLQNNAQLFDFVISNPPVYRIPKPQAQHQFHEVLERREISSEMSLNFVQLGLQKLSDNGRAAFLVHMGTLFSATEIKIRQEWVQNRLLKAVISLSDRLLPHTNNKCAILIFDKERSEHGYVSFVKAEDLSRSKPNGQNVLLEDAIERINTRLNSTKTTYNSAKVSIEKIADSNYSLYPDHYVLKEINEVAEKISKQWVPIAKLATVIQGTRNLGSIPDGKDEVIVGKSIRQMNGKNPFLEKKDLSSINGKVVKTEPYDLLVQRIGESPAVHMILPEQADMVVDQTVFVLRFTDPNPAFIHFIAEFLNSERGTNHIASFCHNVTVQTLTKKILLDITIPIADDSMQSLMLEISHAENLLKQETLKASSLKAQIFEGLGYEKIENDFDSIRFSLNTLEIALKNKDKISYKVSNQYPYPLAYAYRNLYADREWSATYESQMKFGELILSFMVSVGLGLLNHHRGNVELDRTTILAEVSKALQGGISPGHWQKFLHLICAELRKVKDCALSSQLSASWFKGRGNKLSEFGQEIMPALISKLNDKKHWRGPIGSHASKEAVSEHQASIDRALLDIEFFAGWDFFINDQLNYLNNLFTCSITLLRGDHPCFEQKELKLNTALSNGDIYCSYKETIVNLSPFLVSLFNSNTHRTEVFSLDKKNKNGKYMLKSFDSGQSIEAANDLTEKFDLLLGK